MQFRDYGLESAVGLIVLIINWFGLTMTMTMTMTIHLLSGIAAHRTYDYIQYIHIESNKAIHRLHTCHFKSIQLSK